MSIDATVIKDFLNISYVRNLLLVTATILCVIVVYRFYSGDEVDFWVIKIKPDARVKELKEKTKELQAQFDKMDKQAIQKGTLLKFFNDCSTEINVFIDSIGSVTFDERKEKLYYFILPSMITILTRDQANSHRMAIFIKDDTDDRFLKIFKGCGYSIDGQNNLRLEINNSFAGTVFRSGKVLFTGDVNLEGVWTANPKARKEYRSLACIPICGNNKVLGVLNLDGEKVNSFDQDDIDYLGYFSNMLGIIFQIDELHRAAIERTEEATG